MALLRALPSSLRRALTGAPPPAAVASPAPAADRWAERRRYPRVQAPVLCRSVPLFASHPMPAIDLLDLSLGGARVYADERRRVGERLELELFPPRGRSIVAQALVAWVRALPPDAPAVYDVGLEFTGLTPAEARRLRTVLDGVTTN